MSASGEDTKNLIIDGETPAATCSEGISNITPTDTSCVLKDVEPEALIFEADCSEDPGDVEAVIEKKLPSDKEKALDVDSELDFELKWDDDTDLNENHGDNDDIDLDSANKLLESDLTSMVKEAESIEEKATSSLEEEFDSAFPSTEKDLGSLHTIDSEYTSIEKDLDSMEKEMDCDFTCTEKDLENLDHEIESNSLSVKNDNVDIKTGSVSTTIQKQLINNLEEELGDAHLVKEIGDAPLEKEIDDTVLEKDLDLVNKDIEHAIVSLQKDIAFDDGKNISDPESKNNSDIAMDVDDISEENQTIAADNESGNVPKDSDVLIPENIPEEKINVVASAKIDTGLETSPTESETNSLDEELVYSDAEAPDIENKELMDEIDAEITAEIYKEKLESAETPQVSSESLAIEKESKGKATEKVSTIDFDDVMPKPGRLVKPDLNETLSSLTDLETSTYDINNEHGLDRPDVMIEIPTQELIESFDDTKDLDDNLDQSTADLVKTTTIEYTKKTTKPEAMDDVNLVKDISDEIDKDNSPFCELLTEKETTDKTNKSVRTEVMEVDTDDVSKEIEKSKDIENPQFDSNLKINKLNQENISTLDDKVSHADLILEATTESEVTPLPEVVQAADESKDVEFTENLECNKIEDAVSSHVDETQPTAIKSVESLGNSIIKEDTIDSHVNKAQPSTSEDIEISDQIDQEITKDAQTLTSTNKESSDDVKPTADVEDTTKSNLDEAQPSTSTQEVSGSSAESSKLKEIETDNAQSSTTNHSELSDEDQEATDSLGLLAESSRVMDDDEEQEAEPDDEDDDDDFDQDDESNQMTAEHSEDSNAQHSEADVPKEAMDVDDQIDTNEPQDIADAQDIDDTQDIDDGDDEKSNDDKDVSNDEKDESSDDKDESNDERDDLQIQIGDVLSQTDVETLIKPAESGESTEESVKAIETILEDKKEESIDIPSVLATVEDKDAVKPTDTASESVEASSKLRQLLLKESSSHAETLETENKSPSKSKKLSISKPKNDINIVELEESSSEDDVQVVKKSEPALSKDVQAGAEAEAAAGADTSLKGETTPKKPIRLNTDEVSIKTTPAPTITIPEVKAPKTTEPKASIDFGLEIYSLDSDDEETEVRSKRKSKLTAVELDKARQTNKCINMHCTSDVSVPLVPATMCAAVYYAANQQRGGGLCLHCAKRFEERSEKLIEGVKDLTPFLSMDMCTIREEFVEISDSDSEDEPEVGKDDEIIGEKGAKFLEEHLADVFNDAWKKYNMEERLLAAQSEINVEVSQLEEECKQIDAMLNECQKETDKLRNDLYSAFADDRKELPAISICDTPTSQWSGLEEAIPTPPPVPETREPQRYGKRRATPAPEPAAKRAAIPLGYAPLDDHKPPEPKAVEVPVQHDDDNADISVVKLSVEAAPAGLPPPGVATRPPLRPNMLVFAMRNTFGAWHKVRIVEVQPKVAGQFTMCRVRFEQPKTMTKLLPARCLAYEHAPDVRLTIGTRVVALFKDHRVSSEKKEEGEKKEAYYSGIVAEIPNPVNSFRYLIFFDDGYAQYVQHSVTRLVCECAPRVWDEVHPFSRQFVRDYLRAYPERPMVRLHAGQSIKTEWDGKWWVSKVLQVDASLVLVYFDGKKDNKTEWIYRGSTRLAPLYLELQAAERTRARPLPRAQAARRFNMPYVEYTRSDEPADRPPAPAPPAPSPQQFTAQFEQEIRRQRAVAKKSTAPTPAPPPAAPKDTVTSRVVFYTPKNAIKPHKMVPHTCGPKCKRTDVLALKDLRTYNPLTKPLLSGWERQQVRYRIPAVKAVMYRAPCGRRIRDYRELHRYLRAVDSDMGVDLFDFNPATHCLAEFLLNKCIISKKDLSHGKENVPVPCVNYYDSSLPEFCSYNTERTPTAGVPLNLDPDFLCGCDCTDDCADKSKCACWKMTLEGARTIGLDTDEVGYVYKRLPEPLPSGIYECNSRCKCKQTCLNRVAQHPLQLKLQVFKTANRGWGIRALNDVPKGAFLCVYAGNLLTDATANLDGLNEGDEYLAELDYIEVVEQMKEGFEEDIPEDAKKLDEEESESSEVSSSSDEEQKQDGDDDDFRPAMSTGRYTPSEYSKRLRKREKSKKAKEKEDKDKKEREEKQKDGEDCITISDDEELREPAHFSVQTGMKGKEFVSKYKSVRTLFGKDEACYIMDAKVQGNIGRYLNHSCTPNVFVQNVFVDTHDPRFPWVAFFALSQIRAGTELTWNYNYDVGSVPGKVLYCYCNAPNCRGRLL